MSELKKEFVPYQEALELKELGFDEPCFAYFEYDKKLVYTGIVSQNKNSFWVGNEIIITAPTYSQSFRFFREKYRLHQYIQQNYGEHFYFHIEDMVHPRRWDEYTVEMLRAFNESSSQEEAELACLKKLIELVKNKQHE